MPGLKRSLPARDYDSEEPVAINFLAAGAVQAPITTEQQSELSE
jgi:hypothetical protein